MSDHYQQASTDVRIADGESVGEGGWAPYYLARAQVHATLALVDALRDLRNPPPLPGFFAGADARARAGE